MKLRSVNTCLPTALHTAEKICSVTSGYKDQFTPTLQRTQMQKSRSRLQCRVSTAGTSSLQLRQRVEGKSSLVTAAATEESLGFTDHASSDTSHPPRDALLNASKKNKAKEPWRDSKKCRGRGKDCHRLYLCLPILVFAFK